MSNPFARLSERQIQKALAEGTLSNLRGEGAPLPKRPETPFIDAGEGVGYRIMHEHGALPEEIGLRKALDAAKAAFRDAEGEAARKGAMAKIAEIEMKLAIATEARKSFMR